MNRSVYSRASVPSQVLDGVLLDRLGFHVQVSPRLDAFSTDTDHGLETGRFGLFPPGGNVLCGRFGGSRGVVDVLSDDLVRADGGPPERPVDNIGDQHGDWLREDGCGVGFQRKGLDEFDEVRVGVGSRTGQGKRGTDRRLGCAEHDGEGLGDVQDMGGTGPGLTVVQVEQGGVRYGPDDLVSCHAACGKTDGRPISTGQPRNSQATAFNNQSSPPNKGPGLAMVASGKASLTATSPSYLVL